MMQLNLAFAELPNEDSLWEQLDESAREVVIDKLAHAIAKVVAESDPNPREGRYESYLPQDRRQPFATCRVRLHPPVQCYQIEHNRESIQRQYALAQRAVSLGWHKQQVSGVGEDLGLSGARA